MRFVFEVPDELVVSAPSRGDVALVSGPDAGAQAFSGGAAPAGGTVAAGLALAASSAGEAENPSMAGMASGGDGAIDGGGAGA